MHSGIVKNGQQRDGQPGGIWLNSNRLDLAEIAGDGHGARFHSIVANIGNVIRRFLAL
eukprot:COSAG02_NODE_26891_length_621_cov_1.591954_1_plen_57_part_10